MKPKSRLVTYAQHLRQRRLDNKIIRAEGAVPAGLPIPGVRTPAALARKERSRVARANRKAREAAEALARKSAAEQRQAAREVQS